MSLRVTCFTTTFLAAMTATPVFGQLLPGRRPFLEDGVGTPFLLRNKGVQKEIKLTEKQQGKIQKITGALRQKYRQEFVKARGNRLKMVQLLRESTRETRAAVEKALPDILSTEQAKRFKQIELQVNGVHALARSNIQNELELNDTQIEKVKQIEAGLKRDVVAGFRGAAAGPIRNMPELIGKARTLNDKATKKALDVLTAEQQKKWQDMTGEKFELKFAPLNRRRARP